MAGRKLTLTTELIDRICLAIRAGNYAKVACEMVGIGESTYYHWLELAEKPNAKPIYRELLESIKRAEAEAEVQSVALIKQAAQEGKWQAATWYLERKHNDRWGRKDTLTQQITGANGESLFAVVDEARKSVLDFLGEDEEDESISIGEDIPQEQE